MQANQIAHRKLPVAGRIDHILQSGRFNEEILPIREHLVMHEWMLRSKLLTKVVHSPPNLRQLDLVLSSQRIQDVRLGQIVEGQTRALRISESDDWLGAALSAGTFRV
jgi:hypothetical protein